MITQEETISFTYEERDTVVQELLSLIDRVQVYTFTGPLGAGKTTIIKDVLRACDVQGNITSPTFNYVNIYRNNEGLTFYHFDLYRIKSIDEFISAGFQEYLYQEKSWAFIEWPEIITTLLNHAVCNVQLDYGNDENSRLARIKLNV